eukprot:7697649-Karenia_brevis.AAC.1
MHLDQLTALPRSQINQTKIAQLHLSQHVLDYAIHWELNHLLRIFKFRWKGAEGQMMFKRRTTHCMQKWFEEHRVLPLHIRILKEFFKSAWKEKSEQRGFVAVCGGRATKGQEARVIANAKLK